nr:probable carboxylesterase 2 [Tanacetum cinerariifolium]
MCIMHKLPFRKQTTYKFQVLQILLCVDEKDEFRVRGSNYKKVMENSGWKGRIELMECKGGRHGFFLFDPSSENARGKKEWGLSPKAKVRVLHTAQLDVTVSSNH